MKKLALLAFALVFVATANAQSSATTNQSGSGNNAQVTQANSSTASVTQNGREADTPPDGFVGNDVHINQAASTATIGQDGEENVVGGIPLSPRSEFVQTDGSDLKVSQVGARNVTLGSQAGGSTADIVQNTSANLYGEGNAVELTQTDGANVRVYQNFNGRDGGFYGGAEAYINQSGGSLNDADVYQTGDGNRVDVTQSAGDNNYAEAYQRGFGASAALTQQGSDNRAYVNQGRQNGHAGYTPTITGEGSGIDASSAIINQFSDNNYASVAQSNRNVSVYTTNTAVITQQGGMTNNAEFAQIGDDNVARLLQGGTLNTADVRQDGDGNRVEGLGGIGTAALQNGSGHTLSVMQTGNGHVAQVGQTGSGNSTTITQN